jgi:phosphoglycerol transferase MdoB-like AlkP superfamily enzyme
VFDEYMYQYAIDYLKENTGKPIFLFMLSTTHHPPFMLPDNYKPLAIEVPSSLKERLIYDEEKARLVFSTYQYANNQLGKFISNVKKSSLADKSIIAASGDHNTRDLIHYPATKDQMQQVMVPFYLYLPKHLRKIGEFDSKRYGSHKDIFPTIYHKALSEQLYFDSGNNLLALSPCCNPFWGLHTNSLAVSSKGMVKMAKDPNYHQWKKQQVPMPSKENVELKSLSVKVNAYHALMRWQIAWQIEQDKKKKFDE